MNVAYFVGTRVFLLRGVYLRVSQHRAQFVCGGVVQRVEAGGEPGVVGGAVHLQLSAADVAVGTAQPHCAHVYF